ncbi:hypothetical protein NP233_g450 [Leucocoprinus birnbaumii]|uniref:Uncharacterized protein n=1 Tax=Leucocoprinus birnbaumii TaxID=56174 RepID=A0AAD5W2U4_9AGAR|nr:hypothetical protein NP233_g450 [Leucocoprinus birnbaumii]
MNFKHFIVIAASVSGALASAETIQATITSIDAILSRADSLAQRMKVASSTMMGWRQFPSLDAAHTVTYEECEQIMAAARRIGGTFQSSIGIIVSHKSALDGLPIFGTVRPVAKLALLHFQRSTAEWEELYSSKLPANCTTEIKAACAKLDQSLTDALAALSI